MGEEAAPDLLACGRQALAGADWARARDCFERVLDGTESVEALDGLAEALLWLGAYDAAVGARERAFAACCARGRPLDAADQARWLGFLHGAVRGNEAVASGWLTRAQSMLEGIDEAPQHGWLALDRAPLTRDPGERMRLAETALAIARRFGDPDLEFGALALLGES